METSAFYFLLIAFHQCLHVFCVRDIIWTEPTLNKDFPNTKFCTNLISAGYIHSPEHRDEYDRHSAANDEVGNDQYIVLYSVRVDLRWDTKQRDSREVWNQQRNRYWPKGHLAVSKKIFGSGLLFSSRSASIPYTDQRWDQHHDGENYIVNHTKAIVNVGHCWAVWRAHRRRQTDLDRQCSNKHQMAQSTSLFHQTIACALKGCLATLYGNENTSVVDCIRQPQTRAAPHSFVIKYIIHSACLSNVKSHSNDSNLDPALIIMCRSSRNFKIPPGAIPRAFWTFEGWIVQIPSPRSKKAVQMPTN